MKLLNITVDKQTRQLVHGETVERPEFTIAPDDGAAPVVPNARAERIDPAEMARLNAKFGLSEADHAAARAFERAGVFEVKR